MTLTGKTKLIGGEQELSGDGLFYGTTNSGRSSMRWIIESMGLTGKHLLVPDFLCQIVIDVLQEYDIKITFYHINESLSFDFNETYKKYDAIYLIRYFGQTTHALETVLNQSDIPIILDDVFGIELPPFSNANHWAYFNSLRKISPVADYSQVISNRGLTPIQDESLPAFSQGKYSAKAKKSDFINTGVGTEQVYLNEFMLAEDILDKSYGIYKPEDRSIYLCVQFYKSMQEEILKRKKNLALAKSLLHTDWYIDISPEFPSFLPLTLDGRDDIRRYLMDNNVFLAVHWGVVD